MNSIYLGRAFGIDIRVHLLFVIMMLALASFGGAQVVYLGMLFGLVLLHELGHSLVAQRFGIRVLDITFWPLGGMARMSEMPEDARTEGFIAIAGPLVNFALALLALPLVALAGGLEGAQFLGLRSPADLAANFLWMNLGLGLFNLIPAFPMDGGRVLRSFLGRGGNWLEATESAVSVGRFIALGMCVSGVLLRFWTLPIIGIFVWWTGTRELWTMRLRHGQFGPGLHFQTGTGAIDPFELLRRTAAGQKASDHEGPSDGSEGGPIGSPGGGFSDEDIEKLERFRGRLKDNE